MARAIARGIKSSNLASSSIRTVHSDSYKENDDILVTKEDLKKCSGMIIGSPTHFGNMVVL